MKSGLCFWLLSMALIFHLVTAAGLKVDKGGSMSSSSSGAIINNGGSTCIASRDRAGTSSSSSTSSPWIFYDCHVRTLNLDFTTVTSITASTSLLLQTSIKQSLLQTQQQHQQQADVERTRGIRIECNDKLLFESLLASNQSLFRLVNLRQVEIKSCKIRRIPGLLWAKLPLLRSLSIQTKNSHWSSSVSLELDPGALEGLEQLESLDLSFNNMWSVPDNVFCPLRSLVKLNMSHNRLYELEELSAVVMVVQNKSENSGGYCRQNKLQSVDLSYNSLRHIVRITPGWSAGLKELRLENNLIEQIEDSALSDMRELRLVNFSSNRLVALPPSIFQNNVNLRELYLANNSLSALAPAVFSRLDQLVLLDLSRNMLTSQWIRERMFHGLIRLVILRLSFNHLTTLDASIFKDLISLQALHLDNNRIETIRADAFLLLANLHVLDLSNNRLTTVDPRQFSNLIVLQQLYLDHNKIRQLDENSLKNCSALQDVGLAGNLLQEVPVALRGLGLLRSLDIGENRIFSLTNDSFLGLSQLYGLRMVDNRLKELPSGFCNPLKKLRVLNLAQNRLEKISSSALLACPQLRALRLDSNALEELPAGTLTPQLPSLLWLNVSCNRLRTADWRQLPPSLEWLDLSHNVLQSFAPSIITTATATTTMISRTLPTNNNNNNARNNPSFHLRVLDLSYNNLTLLDSRMIPGSLETIRMNYNRLKTVADDTFSRASRLRRVELVGNQLEVLPLTAIKLPGTAAAAGSGRSNSNLPFSAGGRRSILAEFYLGGNPFICDCSMEWLTRVNQHYYSQPQQQLQLQQQQQYPRVVDLDAISCHVSNPPSVIPLNEAGSDHFLCPYDSHCSANCHCCDFDACDCAMRCPTNCSCYHDLTWSRNIIRCSASLHEAVPEHLPMNATEIYLDGNKVGLLGSHTFIGKQYVRVLFLNDSGIEFIRNKTFNGLRSLEILRLEDNLLTALHGYEFADLGNLRELYLQNNLLGFIAPDTFAHLKLLRDLRLDGNLLVSYSAWELSRNPRLSRFLLAGNPWSCACEFISSLRSFFSTRSSVLVSDFASAKCQENNKGQDRGAEVAPYTLISSLCQTSDLNYYENEILNGNNNIAPLLASAAGSSSGSGSSNTASNLLPSPLDGLRTAVASNGEKGSGVEVVWTLTVCSVAILMLILLVVLIFRKEIYHRVLNDRLNLFCCTTNSTCICSGKKSCPASSAATAASTGMSATLPRSISAAATTTTARTMDESEKLFDAYFLYSKRDEETVVQKIAPELEHHRHHQHHPHAAVSQDGTFFRLCLHYRDLCLSPRNPWNPEMVLSACDASKRIVLVLSRTLLHSEWTNMEFRTTIQTAISRHHRKFIVILLPSLNQHQAWESFTASCPLLKNASAASSSGFAHSNNVGAKHFGSSKKQQQPGLPAYLEWTDENFWFKLKQLFPPPTVRISTLGRHNNCLHNFQQHYYHHYPHPHHPHDAIALPPIPSSSSQPDLALFPHGTGGTTTIGNTTAAGMTTSSIISHSKKPPPSYPLPNLPIRTTSSSSTKLVPTSDPHVRTGKNPSSHSHPFATATASAPGNSSNSRNKSHDDHFYSTLLHEFPSHPPREDKKQPQNSRPDVIANTSLNPSPGAVATHTAMATTDNVDRGHPVNNDSTTTGSRHATTATTSVPCSPMNLSSATNIINENNSDCHGSKDNNHGVVNNLDNNSSSSPFRTSHSSNNSRTAVPHQCQSNNHHHSPHHRHHQHHHHKTTDNSSAVVSSGSNDATDGGGHGGNESSICPDDSTNNIVTDSSNGSNTGGDNRTATNPNGPTYFV